MKPEIKIETHLENTRRILNGTTSRDDRSAIGQFLTPIQIACYMASLFEKNCENVKILDPGAGVGALYGALVAELCLRDNPPKSIEVDAYENDKTLIPHLNNSMVHCDEICKSIGINFNYRIICDDFITAGIEELNDNLFRSAGKKYTHAILNPPYKKINSKSTIRKRLDNAGFGISNMYAAFVWLSVKMLEDGGEIVAITPRSFCNGPYFTKFRKAIIDILNFRHIHVFNSRKEAFSDDSVLQESVIFYGVRGEKQQNYICISTSNNADFNRAAKRNIPYNYVVLPGDTDSFIHLIDNDEGLSVMNQMANFRTNLCELGLNVSTGPVVEYRARQYILNNPESGIAPLIHSCNFYNGLVCWPSSDSNKSNAILLSNETKDFLIRSGYYVLTKRISSKEEHRRVVAVLYDPNDCNMNQYPLVGIENHLNYFHSMGAGMQEDLAKGLSIYLNSTIVDQYFRLFNGHTQVNATDLRKIGYPLRNQLLRLGQLVKGSLPSQESIDLMIEKECKLIE